MRTYQYDYSSLRPSVFNIEERERKALTILKVCQDFLQRESLNHLRLLDVGSSSGIIDNYLANHFREVVGIDIDTCAIEWAQAHFSKPNLTYTLGDAMSLDYPENAFDTVLCAHVYEHVPNAATMFSEIFRVLKPGGFCYFSGNSKLMWNEPHYNLPLLSLLPRSIANIYLRATKRGTHYHEMHMWPHEIKKLCRNFSRTNYSKKIIANPADYCAGYMLNRGSLKWLAANLLTNIAPYSTPIIWILRKPMNKK